jgi:transposase
LSVLSRARNRTGFSDGGFSAEAAAAGCIRFPGFSTGSDGARHLWGLKGAHHQTQPPLKKTSCSGCGTARKGWYDRSVRRVRDLSCGDTRIYLELDVRRVLCKSCGKVKRESLEFLSDNTHFTKRFAYFVGRRCRQATVKDVAQELNLDWHAVKELDKQYMTAQLKRAGTPAPKVIGIDEISIRKGHTYRIVVSDLLRGRPIWFGGTDRSEASMAGFYDWLGPKKSTGIRLAVMDMWRPFRKVTSERAPKAAILFDKFHIMRHLGEALDEVRKREYSRLSGRQRRFIKGQKYTLLSRRENLSLSGKQALKALLKANKRLNTAYMLKESFGQLWDYDHEGWARKFFENWRASLKWQRIKSYEKFAELIERHWDGIATHCKPENKVSLGFVEGLNTKIRVIQRRAYGLHDEEYLRLKILTCMLPKL